MDVDPKTYAGSSNLLATAPPQPASSIHLPLQPAPHRPFQPRAPPQFTSDELALQDAYENSKTIFHGRRRIEAGDLVIVYMSRENLAPIIITPGAELHNKYGRYKHDDMIGCRFGSKFRSPSAPSTSSTSSSNGYIHLLSPSPTLWTQSLPHRTQILYLPDISFIMQELGVRVGSRVVEAGTGSGSMSHALGMGVGPGGMGGKGGKVFSFEYHATRFEKALKEFSDHGLSDTITLAHRNVCKDGFGDEAVDVDSVFLDLPAPWDAIPHAAKILRTDISTRICCFSPCIEQVSRTVTALDAEGFSDIAMYEVLARSHEIALPVPTFRTVSSISEKNKLHSEKKEIRRRYQMMNARERKVRARGEGTGRGGAGKVEGGEEDEEMVEPVTEGGVKRSREGEGEAGQSAEVAAEEPPAKRAKVDEADTGPASSIPDWLIVKPTPPAPTTTKAPGKSNPPPLTKAERNARKPTTVPFGAPPRPPRRSTNPVTAGSDSDNISDSDSDSGGPSGSAGGGKEEPYTLPTGMRIFKPVAEMRGHTSYLTFATMIPKMVREEMEVWEGEKERRRKGRAEAGGMVLPVRNGLSGTQGTEGTQGSVATSVGHTTFESDGMGHALNSMTEEELANLGTC